ncbi:hypothetical protein PQO01_08430 [Lentisphaera marina]|uniref:hypothetical protein n=1 Tax=Lentisphaera marina TaxID=1111041 RepID=UPI0023662D23|nr:hypothetical protein [Lentisphaera marina]MDD7984970.1 hypothetical protein [Lentisphaera marina]
MRQNPYEITQAEKCSNPLDVYGQFNTDSHSYEYTKETISSDRTTQIVEYKLKAKSNLVFKDERERWIGLIAYINPRQDVPLLMIQPISKGKYRISKYVAEYFYKRGWNCVIVKREEAYKKLKSPVDLNLQMHELILDNRLIIDFLHEQKPFLFSDIAMFGISKGGIKTSMILGDDQRVSAGVMVLAGGDLANMLSESDEKGIKRVREEYIKENGGGLKGFRESLKRELEIDPLIMAPYIDGRKTLHILAYFDKSVPYKYGHMLFEAMPGAQSYTLMAGHYSAILYLPFILNRSESFYRKKLSIK